MQVSVSVIYELLKSIKQLGVVSFDVAYNYTLDMAKEDEVTQEAKNEFMHLLEAKALIYRLESPANLCFISYKGEVFLSEIYAATHNIKTSNPLLLDQSVRFCQDKRFLVFNS